MGASLLAGKKLVIGEAFNFGPSAEVNQLVQVLIEGLAASWGQNACWQSDQGDKAKMAEAGLLKLNCDKALYRFGWKPTLSFAEVIDMLALGIRVFISNSPC